LAGVKKIILSIDGNLYGITSNTFVLIDRETLATRVLQTLPDLHNITEDPITGEIFLISGFNLIGYR
jgi:hypothetical protein